MERVFLDWLAVLSTVATGFVLAFAALFAYAIQRARYLKDIEPDLRFGTFDISVLSTLDGSTIHRITFSYSVVNASRNATTNLRAALHVTATAMPPAEEWNNLPELAVSDVIMKDELLPERTWQAM